MMRDYDKLMRDIDRIRDRLCANTYSIDYYREIYAELKDKIPLGVCLGPLLLLGDIERNDPFVDSRTQLAFDLLREAGWTIIDETQ
jgi:hypothetical protein